MMMGKTAISRLIRYYYEVVPNYQGNFIQINIRVEGNLMNVYSRFIQATV